MQETLQDYHTVKNLKQFVKVYSDDNWDYKSKFTMGFGKHKGTKVDQVPQSYYFWAKKTVEETWYCECGWRLGNKKPDPGVEHATVCPRCGRDHSWGT